VICWFWWPFSMDIRYSIVYHFSIDQYDSLLYMRSSKWTRFFILNDKFFLNKQNNFFLGNNTHVLRQKKTNDLCIVSFFMILSMLKVSRFNGCDLRDTMPLRISDIRDVLLINEWDENKNSTVQLILGWFATYNIMHHIDF